MLHERLDKCPCNLCFSAKSRSIEGEENEPPIQLAGWFSFRWMLSHQAHRRHTFPRQRFLDAGFQWIPEESPPQAVSDLCYLCGTNTQTGENVFAEPFRSSPGDVALVNQCTVFPGSVQGPLAERTFQVGLDLYISLTPLDSIRLSRESVILDAASPRSVSL